MTHLPSPGQTASEDKVVRIHPRFDGQPLTALSPSHPLSHSARVVGLRNDAYPVSGMARAKELCGAAAQLGNGTPPFLKRRMVVEVLLTFQALSDTALAGPFPDRSPEEVKHLRYVKALSDQAVAKAREMVNGGGHADLRSALESMDLERLAE